MLQVVFYSYLALIGLCLGSFLNVLADRLSMQQSILGRSHCDHCRRTLHWRDLIPLVSFIATRGTCRRCHKGLSWQYPAVEMLTAASYVAAWMYSPDPSLAGHILTLVLVSVLIVIFVADIRYQIIPDEMQVAGILVGTAFILISPQVSAMAFFQAILSGVYTMFPILAIYAATRGAGMGFGDVKWAFVMGYLLGFPQGWVALYVAFIMGGVVGAALLLSSRAKLKQKIAFGPFLIAATVFIFFTRQGATALFLHMIGYQ